MGPLFQLERRQAVGAGEERREAEERLHVCRLQAGEATGHSLAWEASVTTNRSSYGYGGFGDAVRRRGLFQSLF